VDRVRSEPDLALGTYAIPSLHCLWANPERPLLSQRAFRRALVYGIPRVKILEQQLLREGAAPDSRVTSGPFLLGRSFEDPMGYAYDETIAPRPYEPLVAMTLSSVAFSQAAEMVKGQGGELKEMPTLTLGYPPEDLAEVASRAIGQQLQPLGIRLELKELPADASRESYRGYDLVYLRLAMWEPVVDARRLLGSGGIVGQSSQYMDLALRRLEQASEWGAARKALREIHQIAFEDTSVIPLWQLTEYFAYHRSLRGLAERPVLLYENIEQWQTAPWTPSDAP
jgi:ABC-type transport system substrate-binding protein